MSLIFISIITTWNRYSKRFVSPFVGAAAEVSDCPSKAGRTKAFAAAEIARYMLIALPIRRRRIAGLKIGRFRAGFS
jgi:hypothetical protein